MNGIRIAICGLSLITGSMLAAETMTLKDQTDKISYSIGLNVGQNLGAQLKQDGIKINADALAQGIKDGCTDGKKLLTDAEIMEVMKTLQSERANQSQALAEKNKKDGTAFLTANKAKEGVKTLKSGLQYKVIKEGTGPTPKLTDTVAAHYRGTLIDGTEFDSSAKQGKAVEFPVNRVIKGWTEALQLMKVGSKWQLFIPSELAYGEDGAGQLIGPNSTLIFDVELVSIK